MDSYLDIAKAVLQATRRPLSANSILEYAYKAGIVPSHLHGRTQQKTLQARLSEDILHRRQTSIFYRTKPGQFALKAFLEDPDFPAEWKEPFRARRRTRDLKRAHTIGVRRSIAESIGQHMAIFDSVFLRAEAENALVAMHPDDMKAEGYCAVWTFSIVRRDDCVLAYRIGRYRDDRDAFANRRSIGFPGALTSDDLSLFSQDRMGVTDCAITVLKFDLDLTLSAFENPSEKALLESGDRRPAIDGVIAVDSDDGSSDVVVVLSWKCPDWFEPTTRRLSLNELDWLCSKTRPNDIDDFEPWSAKVLAHLGAMKNWKNGVDEQYYASTSSISPIRAQQ